MKSEKKKFSRVAHQAVRPIKRWRNVRICDDMEVDLVHNRNYKRCKYYLKKSLISICHALTFYYYSSTTDRLYYESLTINISYYESSTMESSYHESSAITSPDNKSSIMRDLLLWKLCYEGFSLRKLNCEKFTTKKAQLHVGEWYESWSRIKLIVWNFMRELLLWHLNYKKGQLCLL